MAFHVVRVDDLGEDVSEAASADSRLKEGQEFTKTKPQLFFGTFL